MTENKSTESRDGIVVQDATEGATDVQVHTPGAAELRWARPELDVFESDAELLLKADMPGVSRDAVALTVEEGQLTLEGRWTAALHDDRVFAEHTPTHYRRVLRLPSGLDLGRVTAKLGDGVLEVHLPFAAAVKPRQIEVQGVN